VFFRPTLDAADVIATPLWICAHEARHIGRREQYVAPYAIRDSRAARDWNFDVYPHSSGSPRGCGCAPLIANICDVARIPEFIDAHWRHPYSLALAAGG
jgi:hypothetical protein